MRSTKILGRMLRPFAKVEVGEGLIALLMLVCVLLILTSFFIWLGLVSVFLIAQFWSYANDIYSEEVAPRSLGREQVAAGATA